MSPVSEAHTKPKFLKLFESSTVKENSALLLTCQVFGEPMPDIYWHKDGKQISGNKRVQITHGHNGASQLFISRALMDDAGVYQVSASNDHGIAVYNSEINVEASEDFANNVFQSNYSRRDSSGLMTRNERDFVAFREPDGGHVARLKCSVKQDDVEVNWLRDETIINTTSAESRYTSLQNGKERVLVVNDVQDLDDGEYICQSGKYRVTLHLDLNESPDIFRPPSSSSSQSDQIYFPDDHHHFTHNRRQSTKLIHSPPTTTTKFATTKDIYVNSGVHKAELKCRVNNDNTQVEWLRNEQPIMSNKKYQVLAQGSDRILLIKEPNTLDNGDYVCQSGKHRVVLTLNVNPGNNNITPHMYSSEDDSVFLRNSNTITGRDTDLVFYNGQQATLKCQVANEQERVIWLKDNSYIPHNDKFSCVEDGPFRILNIQGLESRDSGNYFCQSEKNKASKIGFKVGVKEVKTEIFKPLNDIRVGQSNEKIVFEIVTQSPRSVNPSRVKWYKDGMEINQTTDHRFTLFNYFNDNKADGAVLNFNKLVIDPPLSGQYDQGEYTCVINNDLRSSARLIFEHGFKPTEVNSVKKSQLEGFQTNLTTTTTTTTTTTNSTTENKSGKTTFISQAQPVVSTAVTTKQSDLAFVKEMPSFTECIEGHDCILECVVNKFETRALWYIDTDEEAISMGNTKYEILNHDGRKHKLIIKKATPNDNALYTCRINDCLQTNTFVTVAEEVPLRIVENLNDFHVADKLRNLELTVVMNKRIRNDKAHGTLIRWYMNKKEMKAGHEYEHLYIDNRIILKYLREVLYAVDNNAQIECRIQEIKMGLHNVELVTKCRMIVDQIGEERGFTKRLDDLIQHESGLSLDLEARVNFDAQLVKWFKNNAQILNDQSYQLIEDAINRSFMLRFKCCKLKESGVYTIDVDGLQCSGEVKILETPIKFVQPLEDQFFDLENDTSITLDCQLNKPPLIRPRWFKNDLEIILTGSQASKYDMIEEHNICALIIYDLDERDEGRYRCQVGNERTDCRIKPEYILTKYLPNYIEQREGETCQLAFAINRPPNGQVTMPVTKWFKDSHEIIATQTLDTNKYRFIEQGNERSLLVLNCKPGDSGLYKAYIMDESAEPPVSLVTTNSCQVHIKKLKVEFVNPLDSVMNVYEDETVKMYCETVQENLKAKWFFNDKPIETNQDPSVSGNKEVYSTQTQHFLIINKVQQKADSGVYSVRFSSDPLPSSSCQLIVHKSGSKQTGEQIPKGGDFLIHLQDVKCDEGDDFQLVGALHRNLQSTDLIEWKKNGEFLVNSMGNTLNRFNENLFVDSEFELSCAGNTCTLEFKNAKRHDAGVYELNIVELDKIPSSQTGSGQPLVYKSKCTVNITSYIAKPDIVKPLPRGLKLNEGETLKLECQFSKKPDRVDWQRNSIKLTPHLNKQQSSHHHLSIAQSEDGTCHTLQLTNCTPNEHSGTYQIKADDKLSICEVKVVPTTTTTSTPAVCKFKQPPPKTIVYDCVKEMEDGNDTLSIDCVLDKNAGSVRWLRCVGDVNDEIVQPSDKYELVVEGPIRCLLIHDVNGDDAGEYECRIDDDDDGGEFAKTTVKVLEARPALIEPSKRVNKVYEAKYEKIDVYEGKGLVMGIDLDSSEQSRKCSWFKDQNSLDVNTCHVVSNITDNKKHTLKIDKLLLVDTGRYELIMNDLETGKVTLAIIDLNVKEKPISIVKKLNAQKVQNNLLMLECEVSKPIGEGHVFSWSKDGHQINVDDQHLARKVEGVKCRLFINKFDYVDSGTYEFSVLDVNSPELRESTNFRLEIKQNPFKSGMKVVNTDFNATRTLRIEFETVSDRFETTDMKWIKDGQQINFNSPIQNKYAFYKANPTKFILEINDVNSNDNGAYSCGIDEFTNKLNLSGIENLENQAITEEVEEAVEELAEVIQGLEAAKNAQANIIEELEEIIDSAVDKNQVETHAGQVVDTSAEVEKSEEIAALKEVEEAVGVRDVDEVEMLVEEAPVLKKSESMVSLVEEVNPVESVEEKGVDSVQEEKVKIVETIEEEDLSKKKMTKLEKEPVQVKPVEEVNVEEKLEEILVDKTEPEKAVTEEVKPEKLEETDKPKEKLEEIVDILKSTWLPQVCLEEGDSHSFEMLVNGEFKPDMFCVYKDGVKLKPSDFTVKKNTAAANGKSSTTEVKFSIKKAKQTDTAVYKLTLNDKEIGQSSVKVDKKLSVSSPLKSDKTEYVEDEDILLKFEVTKPLVDKEKSIGLSVGARQIDLNSDCEHYGLVEEVSSDGSGVSYTIKVKSCQLKKDDGLYKLKILLNPQIDAGKVDIKIKEKPVQILRSDWLPETNAKENDEIVLGLTIDKPLENANGLSLFKDNKPVKLSKDMVEIVNGSEIKVKLPSGVKDSGKYRLVLNGKTDLGETDLKVTPFSIVDKLKADKCEYFAGDEVVLRVGVNGKVENVEKCVRWTLNGKVIDSKVDTSVVCSEEVEEKDKEEKGGCFVYLVKVSKCEVKKHGGEYMVKIKQKIADKKELSDSVTVRIVDGEKASEEKFVVVESNWRPEIEIKESDNLELKAKVNRTLEPKDVIVYKDADLSSDFKVTLSNNELDGSCDVIIGLEGAKTSDSGALKLCVKNERRDLIGSTKLTVVPLQTELLKVLDSDWKPDTSIKEGEALTLTLTVSRPLEDLSDFTLFKDKKKLGEVDGPRLEFVNKDNLCEIKVVLTESIPPDTGKYKLIYKGKTELAVTNLKVEEIPLKLVKELASDKSEYLPKEDIKLLFVVSKPVSDVDKCIVWSCQGKKIEVLKSKQFEVLVEDRLSDGVVYTLVVKACECGSNDGEYCVRVRSKPSDAKSEFYKGSVNVKINDSGKQEVKFEIVDSNWKPNVEIKEGENLEFFVLINKACNIKDFVLLKDGKKLVETEAIKLGLANRNDESGSERCELKLIVNEAIIPDTGKYRLVYVPEGARPKKEEIELGVCCLKVIETVTEVLDGLKSDKDKYKPGDDIVLFIKLSKPLVDKHKNVTLALNDKKTINISKEVVLTEDIDENLVTVYSFKIKSGQPGVNDGTYSLKLQSKINDVKSQFYSGSCLVKFEEEDDNLGYVLFISI